jgi:SH3 domain-containing protein
MRHAAAIVIVMLWVPSPLHTQAAATFKVGAAPADVYKAPTTASPVIGKAPRGAVLDVTRELGSWVKIAWPAAKDGEGYVHVSAGSIAHAAAAGEHRAAAASPSPPAAAGPRIPPPPPSAAPARASSAAPAAAPPRQSGGYVRAPSHQFGVGGRIGAPDFDLGVAARLWSRDRFGLQAQLARGADGIEPRRATTLEFAPSVLVAARDRVTESWWLRPYAGGGPTFVHRAVDAGVLPGEPIGEGRFGLQGFGGLEVTLPNLPRFALSADLGYRWLQSPPLGNQDSGVRFIMSGHWYLK